jgi:hypothetical protein
MEITYETIVKYLGKKVPKVETNTFLTQKNIFNYATNFPPKFSELLSDKFYRMGVTQQDDKKNNISFWSSLVSLIDKDFIIPILTDEVTTINQFKEQLLEIYSKSKLSQHLKDLDKGDVRERFKLDPDTYVLQYIVDMMDINMLIFDFKSLSISALYKKDILNPWKQTFLFARSDSNWEPIMLVRAKGEIQRTFDYNNMNIRKIILSDSVKYYEGIKKEYIYMDNIMDVIELEKKKLKIVDIVEIDSDSSVKTDIEEDDIFVEKDEINELKQLNKTKLTKMKLNEVIDLAKKLKLLTEGVDNPTKPVMVTMILKKISLLV